MNDIIWHEHHIIPVHMDGTDDKSNLLKCNIACHAFLHKCLYEEQGNEYDRIAWLCLSGQITNAEANIMATKIANTGKTPWNKGKTGVQPSTRKGKPRSEEEKRRIAEGTKKAMVGVKCGRKKGSIPWNKGKADTRNMVRDENGKFLPKARTRSSEL
jgi:hypothetical protein